MSGRPGLGLVAAAAAGLLVAGFVALFERVEVEEEVGLRGAAARDDHLAFARLLRALDVPAGRPGDPLRLPPADHVLVALGSHRPPGPAFQARLLAWLAAGGHLVLVPAPGGIGSAEDPLLGIFEAEVIGAPENAASGIPAGDDPTADGAAEEGAAAEEVSERRAAAQEGTTAAPPTPSVRRPGLPALPALRLSAGPGAPERTVQMPPYPRLADPGGVAVHAAGPEAAPRLLVFPYGQGRVTLLADASFLGNRLLGEADHARFSWDLVTATGVPAGVWITDWRRAVPLTALAARRAWPALVAGGVLLLAWAWSRGTRFGPLLPPAAPQRRSLLEHVRASGDFLWRRGCGGELLAAARTALLRRLELRHTGWSRLPEGERVRRLARLSGVPAGTVAAALEGDAAEPADFTRSLATLERIRRSL